MNYSELQSYIDAGLVPSEPGTHEITQQVTFDGAKRVIVEPNSFVWTGSASSWPLNYNFGSGTSYPIIFNGVTFVSAVDGSPIFKNEDTEAQPDNLHFENCDFTSLGAYAIDLNLVGYMVVPVFRNMVTRGSGALRLRASAGGIDPLHATSQMHIRGWTHIGSDRWGPAFNLRGCSGLKWQSVTDKGSLALHADLLAANWEGPLTLLTDSVRTPSDYKNLTVEYDETNDDDAPNCYIGEIRTTSGTGTGVHEIAYLRNATLRHTAIDAAVKPWRIMGSNSDTGHALVVVVEDCESPSTDDFLIGGRSSVWVHRPHYINGESSKYTNLKSAVTAIFPEATSWQDPIVIEDGKLPAAAFSGGTTYSGSQNETDYATGPLQPEEALEA